MSDTQTQVLDRLHQTLVRAERDLRQSLEGQLRAYHALMQDLVHRLGLAEQLDAARHVEPSAPAGWGPQDWRRFFDEALRAAASASGGWGTQQDVTQEGKAVRRLQDEVQRLRAEVERLKAQAPVPQVQMQPVSEAEKAEQRLTVKVSPRPASLSELAERLRRLEIPSRTKLPVQMRDNFGTGQRYQREVQALWLLSQGLNIRLELDWLMAQANGLKPRSGSIRRLFDRMVESGLVLAETVRLSKPPTSIALLRLSEAGRAAAQYLFGEEPKEGDWERLIRLHEGERFPQHTAAVLIFALHARLRGWRAEVMPEATGNTPPDVMVEKDGQRIFVEVERGEREKATKWRNIAQLNGGQVALCAMTAKHRALLVGDARRQGLPGMATDLEALIAVPWQEAQGTALWLEEWT